jgi:hypothetical protein
MGRRLAAAVHVRHPKTNEWLILEPGDEPDEDLTEVITNPVAWEPDEGEDQEDGEDADGEGAPPAVGTDLEPTPDREAGAKPSRSRRKTADEQ